MQYKAEFYDIEDRLHEVEGLALDDMKTHIESVLKATGSYDSVALSRCNTKQGAFHMYGVIGEGFVLAEPIGYMQPS